MKPDLPAYLQPHPEGVVVSLKVQPRASRNEIVGAIGNELKIKVTAPPVDSAANEAVVLLLADLLACPKGAVRLLRGQTSRHKQVLLAGCDLGHAARQLAAATAKRASP